MSAKEADIEDMFDPGFYLKVVNGEFTQVLDRPIEDAALQSKSERILVRIEEYLKVAPLENDAVFNHFRPARYLSANGAAPSSGIDSGTLDRFEAAFAAVNAPL